MDQNKLQGLWVLDQGLANQEQVRRAYGVAKARPDLDLCAVLLMSKLLTPDQAAHGRAAALEEERLIATQQMKAFPAPAGTNPRAEAPQPSAEAPLENSLEMLNQLMGLSSGQSFRHYVLESELSRGAMGVVFRARDSELDRVLALKFMLTNNPDPAELKRFIREAETLVRLKHPNIVEIYDFGSDKDQCFLAMELVGGPDLSDLVKEQLRAGSPGLAVEDALAHLTPIVGALQYCHEQGVIHRDLKPQNVLVEPLGESSRPVLVDFGLMKKMPGEKSGSRSSGSTAASLTNAGDIVGTPAFMAPEQFRPDAEFGKMGPWTDAWAWGATLYFLLTGSPPYNRASVLEIFQAIVFEETPRISQVRQDIPAWIDDLCARCLQKESAQRPSFREIQALLEGSEEVPKRPFPKVFVGATVILIAFAALLAYVLDSPTELLGSLPWPKETAVGKLTFQGRVNHSETALRVGRIETRSDESGQFKVAVDLLEGQNEVSLEAFVDGAWSSLETRQIYCDTKKPVLELRSEKSKNGFVFIDGERRLQFLIDDKSPPYKIVFDDFQLQTKDPFVELNQLAQSNPEVVVRVFDRLGNSQIQQMKIVTDQGLETFRKAISRLENWAVAPTLIQDGVFDWVDRELGDAYEFIGARVYRCGAQSFRIATYLHKRTGVEFQLIPGQEFRETQWSSPKDAYAYILLDVMSQPQSGPEIIADGISDSGLGNYRSQLRPLFGIQKNERFSRLLQKVQRSKEKIPALKKQLVAWKTSLRENKVVKSNLRVIKPMLVGRFEMSQKQWNKIVAVGARVKETRANWPITNVTVPIIREWLLRVGDGFRLPRPYEWQYACGAGSRDMFFWGNDWKDIETYCWVYENAEGEIHSIKEHSRQSNAFGLCDMLGNVAEWSEVSWNQWSEILKREIEQGRFPEKYSGDLQELKKWKNMAAQMGSQCNWYKAWANTEFYCWEEETDVGSRQGFRVFVTVPLDQ